MRRPGSGMTRSVFYVWVLVALFISGLVSVRDRMPVFLAFLAVGWHSLTQLVCAGIASYRFKNPNAKYIGIKSRFLKALLVRPVSVGGVLFADKKDTRTNVPGLVLSILNGALFLFHEILLFLPGIPCDPYIFTFSVGRRNRSRVDFELYSVNEIVAAEGPRTFAAAMALVLLVFIILFERRYKEKKPKNKRNARQASPRKRLRKNQWHFPLYTALIELSARRNKKKHRFWYRSDQLERIENLVNAASENAALKIQTKEEKPVSFTVIDTLNDHVVFTGRFV